MSYTLTHAVPDVAEYNRVRKAAGLTVKDETAARQGLEGTLFGVSVFHEEGLVGIGRVIGDGGLFFDIVDMAVVSEHQGRGVGDLIMRALMGYIDQHARPSSIVCLMANRGIAGFYEKYGFRARDPDMPGMIIRK